MLVNHVGGRVYHMMSCIFVQVLLSSHIPVAHLISGILFYTYFYDWNSLRLWLLTVLSGQAQSSKRSLSCTCIFFDHPQPFCQDQGQSQFNTWDSYFQYTMPHTKREQHSMKLKLPSPLVNIKVIKIHSLVMDQLENL